MTAHSTLDPESFHRLLCNAFAVQESGMDGESLAAIVKLQRAIAKGESDVDRTMEVIAGHARNVANATGIAIGLLKGDQLVYRAGSGSGVSYIGQHVMATLCVSPQNAASGEILRVENAQTDRRIEAAICRQFGAHSLLILSIYHEGTMVGVLNVLFDLAHVFEHQEALTYRLMANLVGEAMSDTARPGQKRAAADLSTMPQSIGLTTPQREEARNDRASVSAAATNRAIYPVRETFVARAGKVPAFTRSIREASDRAKRFPWFNGRWKAAVGVAAVLLIACWIGFRDRRPALTPEVSGLRVPNAIEQQVTVAPAKRVLANSTPQRQTTLVLDPGKRKTPSAMPARVLDRDIRVRYISDDVTVRYFTPKPPPQQGLHKNIRVRYISDDVTVRYFTLEPLVTPSSRPAGSPAQPVNR